MPLLVESLGAYPYDNALIAPDSFTTIDMTPIGTQTWPYPQLFVLSDCVIVATETALYELQNGGLVLMIGGLPLGDTWSVIDRKTYIYLTNGAVSVTKDPATGFYFVDHSVPFAQCACDYNGQVLLGAPNLGPNISEVIDISALIEHILTEAGDYLTTEIGEPIILLLHR
jgi:hypothetical protein